MSSKKSKKKLITTIKEPVGEKNTKPRNAKIILFLFGAGPLLLMCLFLYLNGFFNSP